MGAVSTVLLAGLFAEAYSFAQSTFLRETWAPDEPLFIDSFADVAPEPSGL